jgi:hypothetical protein
MSPLEDTSSTSARTGTNADVQQMQASAARYMDGLYKNNQPILETASGNVRTAIIALGAEILALIGALLVRLLT